MVITNSFLKILTRLVMAAMKLKMTMELRIQGADLLMSSILGT